MQRLTHIAVLWVALTAVAASAAPTVYVPLGDANKIVVVDAATGKVTATMGGVINPHGLAVTPDGKRLVAGSNRERRPGEAAIPPKPAGMSEEEHRRHHQAPPAGAGTPGPGISRVDVLDAASGEVLRRIDVKGAVHHVLVTPDGRYAVTTHSTAGGISVIDLSTYQVVRTIATGPVPNYAAATRDGKWLYVSNAGNNTVSVIDTATWIVTRNILAGKAPEHLVLSPDEKRLYVNNLGSGTVSVIDLAVGKVIKTYAAGKSPHGIDLSDDGKTLYVAAKGDNTLVAIDLASGRRRTLPLAPAPYHVTAVRGTGKIYVSSRKEPILWVVDQKAFKGAGKIAVGGIGHQMVVVR